MVSLRLRHPVQLVAITFIATLLSALPASANTPGGLGLADALPSTAGGVTTHVDPTAGGALSLTAVLLASGAQQSGLNLDSYLAQHSGQLDSRLGGAVLGASSFEELNSRLTTLSFGNSPSWGGLTSSLATSAATPDGSAVIGGIDLTRSLGQLETPTLSMPSLGAAGAILSARPDQLAFGLFMNQSLAATVKDSPDIIAQVRAGQLSPESQSAFQRGLSSAAESFSGGLGQALPSPCYAGMMLSIANGGGTSARASGLPSSCGACITAGSYLHGRMGDLFSTGKYTADATDGKLTPFEWNNLDASTKSAIEELNPQLGKEMSQVQGGSSTSASNTGSACQSAAAGTTNFLGSNLGGVFGRLGG